MKLDKLFYRPETTAAVVEPEPLPPPAESLALFSPAAANTYGLMERGLEGLREQLHAITILSQDDCNNVARGLAEIKRALKTCEETRKNQTKPLRDQEAAINNTWRRLTDALTQLSTQAERKIIGWNEAERLRRFREEEAARKAAEEARAKADAEPAAEPEAQAALAEAQNALAAVEQAPRGIRTESGTTSSQWRWTFKIVDAALIPRSFLVPDEAAIRNAINCGMKSIPGVAIWQEEKLRTITR